MEYAEGRGVIELQTLRRAAEALGCDLVYGLSPREETLAAIAADTEAARDRSVWKRGRGGLKRPGSGGGRRRDRGGMRRSRQGWRRSGGSIGDSAG